MLAHVLNADLEGRSNSWFERCLQEIGKCTADLLRADQVQLRRFAPLGRREVDRVELVFVQGQAGTSETEAS